MNKKIWTAVWVWFCGLGMGIFLSNLSFGITMFILDVCLFSLIVFATVLGVREMIRKKEKVSE